MRVLLPTLLLLAVPAPAAPARTPPRAVPASDLIIRTATPEIGWRWRIAPEAATQPALLAALRGEALAQRDTARGEAARDAAEAKRAGVPFRRYDYLSDWTLAADTPRLLALAGESYAYTGGAHGNTGYGVAIWDKAAGRRLALADLFTDWAAARAAIEPLFCQALAEEQERRRGEAPANPADACPKLAEQPAVPYAGLAPQAARLRVLLAPYVAGSYAEGSYLIDLPWPDAVRALVKPAYRADLFGAP